MTGEMVSDSTCRTDIYVDYILDVIQSTGPPKEHYIKPCTGTVRLIFGFRSVLLMKR